MTIDIDLFHAVDGGGNCLPGPCRPHGLVHLGPDMVNHNTSGYASGESLKHFSHIHVAGAGGSGRYGCIALVPVGQRPDARTASFDIMKETAELGRYTCTIQQQQGFGELYRPGPIHCQLAASHSGAIHHYRWSEGQVPWIRLDLGQAIGSVSVGGWLRWLDDHTAIGRADYRGGWGHEYQYSVFFYCQTDQAMSNIATTSTAHTRRGDLAGEGPHICCVAKLADETSASSQGLTVRLGMSLVSVARAQANFEQEVAHHDISSLAAESSQEWEQLISRFQVRGGSSDDRTMWHTLWQRLYQIPTLLQPAEVPWFHAQQEQVNDLICIWDSVRGANSLLALVQPDYQVQLCNALTEIGEQTGWIPDAWLMGASGQIQGGCSAAILFAEAVKKALPNFDAQRAFNALHRHNTTPSPDTFLYGRYPQWGQGHNLPSEVPQHVSRTLEYAFHDHCTATLAQAASSDRQIIDSYQQASDRLWQLWDERSNCFAPRLSDGQWDQYNPWKPSRPDFWADPHFYEGTAHDYTLGSWHLLPSIVERIGGGEAFINHLDTFLEQCYHWKEINLHVPWLYHFAGRPDLSTPALRRIADRKLRLTRDGMADNEDFGAWSSWWLGQAMGLGVMPGSDRYLIGVPRFDEVTLDLGPNSDRPLHIRCEGASPQSSTTIEQVTINGKPHPQLALSRRHCPRRGDRPDPRDRSHQMGPRTRSLGLAP